MNDLDQRLQMLLSGIKSLNGFADSIDVPRTTLHRLKKGVSKAGNITIDNFRAIAHGLGMTIDELYYGVPQELPIVYRRYASLPLKERELVDNALELAEYKANQKSDEIQSDEMQAC